MGEPQEYLYGGLSGTTLGVDSFELGRDVRLDATYAHLMSPYIVAFSRPTPAGPHEGPWQAAKGGSGFDIAIELRVPNSSLLGSLEPRETIWWIAALLRIGQVPQLTVPVTSNYQFAAAKDGPSELSLEPLEVTPRIFHAGPDAPQSITAETLEWIKRIWDPAGQLLATNSKFYTALKAFDSATVAGKSSSAMLALWGGLEQLFAPSAGELRFRVSALIAAYSEPAGAKRLECYKRVLRLYNERSQAAHTASEVTTGPLLESYVLMRNVLVRMIDECDVPTQASLEDRLFGVV